jgi:hypothetical protein
MIRAGLEPMNQVSQRDLEDTANEMRTEMFHNSTTLYLYPTKCVPTA